MTLTSLQRQTLSWLAMAGGAALLLWLLAPVLTPFIVGAVLAYALHPAVERLAARRVPRVLAVVLVEAAALLAVLALALLLVPVLAKELPLLQAQVPPLLDKLDRVLSPWLQQFGLQVSLDLASIKAWLTKLLNANLDEWLGTAMSSVRIGGSLLLSVLGNAFLVPVVLFYLLLDGKRLVGGARQLVPPRLRDSVGGFLSESDHMLGQYMRGQAVVMVVLAVYYSAGLAIAGFDLALPVGVFTGLAVAVPYVGFGLGLLMALLAALLQFASIKGVLAVVVVYGLGQVFEGFVLTPRLVGERIGLSPLAVIFALLAFGQLFGFVGVLIALPVSAVAVVGLRRARTMYLASRLYQG
ncbi:MAG: AI-2E family transporter [Burkholderiales bacterium]|nr:AI-2E family transporter [Burkholderiales bacterium]